MEEELDDLLSQMNSSTDTPTASVSEQLQSVPNRPKLKKIKRPVARVERGRFVINEIDLY